MYNIGFHYYGFQGKDGKKVLKELEIIIYICKSIVVVYLVNKSDISKYKKNIKLEYV